MPGISASMLAGDLSNVDVEVTTTLEEAHVRDTRTFCIGGALFSFLEFRTQFFKLGIRSTAGTATRDGHSTMPAVI